MSKVPTLVEAVPLLLAIYFRSGRQIEIDKIVDLSPAERCLLVARHLAGMADDPVVAVAIRDTQVLATLRGELMARRELANA